jgi:uncharacterized protein YjbJ (UPF0337 family)
MRRVQIMNSDQIAGKWKQLKGAAKQQWGKLTDDDLEYIAGSSENLAGKLQERYGIAKEEAQKRADAWLKAQNEAQSEADKEQRPGRTRHETAKR